jgi:hypothetical protein
VGSLARKRGCAHCRHLLTVLWSASRHRRGELMTPDPFESFAYKTEEEWCDPVAELPMSISSASLTYPPPAQLAVISTENTIGIRNQNCPHNIQRVELSHSVSSSRTHQQYRAKIFGLCTFAQQSRVDRSHGCQRTPAGGKYPPNSVNR